MKLVPITDIFDIRYGNQFDLSKMDILIDGTEGINFVSRTSENNGSMATVGYYNDVEPLEAGLITVTLGGSYLLASFIQPKPFYTGQNIKVLTPKITLSEQEKLFYCACIEANRFRYSSHSREANSTFNQISVPAFDQIPTTVKDYNLHDKFIEKPLSSKKLTLDTKNWKTFLAKEVFKITLGRPIHKSDLETELSRLGNPYITRTTERNGTEGYISEEIEGYINNGNAITIGAEGFIAFYQKEDFYNGNKVSILRNSHLNKYNALFLATVLDKEVGDRFSYGRGAVKGKLEKMKIKLPITPTGTPDWQWMEEYIKGLPYSSAL